FGELACTDTNGVYGAVEFQQACEAAGVRPILGAYLVTDHEETVALATDARGWGALCRAISRIHWDTPGPGRASQGVIPSQAKDRVDGSLSASLAADRDGLILVSRDPALLERIVRLSGPRDLYAELSPGKARHAVLAAARRLGLPAAVTNAAVMAHPEDWQRHRLLRAIHLNTTLSALDAPAVPPSGGPASRLAPRDAWLRPAADLARQFPDCPEA